MEIVILENVDVDGRVMLVKGVGLEGVDWIDLVQE
jgi:hypothetical protein